MSTRSSPWRRTAVDRARAGDGPSLIEALTYRHGGHSGRIRASTGRTTRSRPGRPRSDPVVPGAAVEAGVEAAELDAIEAETREAVAAAEAEAGPRPSLAADVLETEVWSDGGSAWRN